MPPVEVLLFCAPDPQVEGANQQTVQAKPGTGLADQPDEGVQPEAPQHAMIEERDQFISVDLLMGCGQE